VQVYRTYAYAHFWEPFFA